MLSAHTSAPSLSVTCRDHGPGNSPIFEVAQSTFKFSTIGEEDVRPVLHSLNVNKATGPNGISALLLKQIALSISHSLTLLFNHSLQAGSFPDEWKLANVIPVPKSGDKQLLQNHALSYFGDPSCCESV